MQHTLLTSEAKFTPSASFAGLPELAKIQAARRDSWRVTFALAAVAFVVAFGVVAFVL